MTKEPHRDERKSAEPWLSPGLVRSDEIVLRTVLDPEHLEQDGKVAAAAISLKDIQYRGWSLDRKRFTSQRRIRMAHSDRKRKNSKILRCYVLPIPVGEIRRSDPKTGHQDFVVTDTALWWNPAHAIVLLSGHHGDGAARGFRTKLLQQLPPYVDVTEVFSSSDKYGYLKGMFRQVIAILISPFRYFFRDGSH